MIGQTIKSILVNNGTLTALVPANRIYPYVMNEDTVLPAITYTIQAIDAEYNKGGWDKDTVTFTVNTFSKNYDNLYAIVKAVRGALEWARNGAGTQEIGNIYLTGMQEGYNLPEDSFFNRL